MSVDYDFGSYFGGDVATEIGENVFDPTFDGTMPLTGGNIDFSTMIKNAMSGKSGTGTQLASLAGLAGLANAFAAAVAAAFISVAPEPSDIKDWVS